MRARLIPLAMALAAASAALADAPVIISKAPDAVSVTFYRDAERGTDPIAIDPDDEESGYGGYALIAETRTITVPPGEATVRFEGVAGGIRPESAILFQGQLKEKNFDSRLLSQRGLIDAFTGQQVTIRRTDPATGKVEREAATILSGPDDLLLKTARGIEAVNCDGTMNTLLFGGVPRDLTAKPTLSMQLRPDNPGGTMTVTLAYLAGNFDWQANYIGTFSPDGQGLRLTGWLTLASGDPTSFAAAEVSAIAGQPALARLSWEEEELLDEERRNDPYHPDNIDLGYSCWPQGTTGAGQIWPRLFTPDEIAEQELPVWVNYDYGYYGGGGGCGDEEEGCEDMIIVTASRIATREDVGDLKLYTIPFASDVPSKSVKQVRFLAATDLDGETLYRGSYSADGNEGDIELVFRFENTKSKGGGEAFPAGQIALFQQTQRGRLLVGETSLEDKAVDEEIRITIPEEDVGVDMDIDTTDRAGDDWEEQELTVENDHEFLVVAEIEFTDQAGRYQSYRLSRFSKGVKRQDGKYIWRVKIGAEDSASIRFRVTEKEMPDYDD